LDAEVLMAFRRRTLAVNLLTRLLAVLVATSAFAYLLAFPSAFAQTTPNRFISRSTTFNAAIVQTAVYFGKTIGLECVSDDVAIDSGAVFDLSTLSFDQALTAVLGRVPRRYEWRQSDALVLLRPEDSVNEAASWLNQPPVAPGMATRPGRPRGNPRINTMEIFLDPRVPAEFDKLTLGESWLELQRPRGWRSNFFPRSTCRRLAGPPPMM